MHSMVKSWQEHIGAIAHHRIAEGRAAGMLLSRAVTEDTPAITRVTLGGPYGVFIDINLVETLNDGSELRINCGNGPGYPARQYRLRSGLPLNDSEDALATLAGQLETSPLVLPVNTLYGYKHLGTLIGAFWGQVEKLPGPENTNRWVYGLQHYIRLGYGFPVELAQALEDGDEADGYLRTFRSLIGHQINPLSSDYNLSLVFDGQNLPYLVDEQTCERYQFWHPTDPTPHGENGRSVVECWRPVDINLSDVFRRWMWHTNTFNFSFATK